MYAWQNENEDKQIEIWQYGNNLIIKMSEFESYLSSQQLTNTSKQLPQQVKYIIIDSDNQNNEYEQIISQTNGKILSNIDTNVTNSMVKDNTIHNRQDSKCGSGWYHRQSRHARFSNASDTVNNSRCMSGNGVINRYIQAKKEARTRVHNLQLEVNKIQAECDSLEQLIQKVIKQQAELQVKKYNMLKQQPRHKHEQPQIKRPPVPLISRQHNHSMSSPLDINKTVKINKSKVL